MGNTILLADKSITIQKIVQLTFADDDYNIHSVSDGQTALDALPKIRPDLILADISLPVKSGYELCSTVRRDPEYSEFRLFCSPGSMKRWMKTALGRLKKG
jgi:CheY-like chemotaxis protein